MSDYLSVDASAGVRSARLTASGFKHSFVSIVSACVACRGVLTIRNAPAIAERSVLCDLLSSLGAHVQINGQVLKIDASGISPGPLNSGLASQVHGSMYLVPALTAACGRADLTASGGCAIGSNKLGMRPTTHIVDVLRAFGADATCDAAGGISASATTLKPATVDIISFSDRRDEINGPLVSGATKAALICAAGVTSSSASSVILNPYLKPDVKDLLRYLNLAGFEVLENSGQVRVRRPASVRDVEMDLTPDLSELVTYLTLSIMSGSSIRVSSPGMHLGLAGLAAELDLFEKMGISVRSGDNWVEALPPPRIQSVDIEVTSTGIFSDHQPFFALLMTRSDRPTRIRDHVWKDRFSYAKELAEFGVRTQRIDKGIVVFPSELTPPERPVHASDLRMAGVLLIAGLLVGQKVELTGAHHLTRGYSELTNKLEKLGAICESQITGL
ncbi:hypothetical protein [Xanthomonas graminis]|uniref:hypothetical protein n=1 Tax=Xanthomonas graminis TaxID=3390026 RepID=UPI001F349DE1|nr:hypothetical protein [Xanthomonas translucens]UKE73362.1 hypothetical protein KFS85_20545 [Xanthomonas translucens pv. phleipratensis]